MVVLFSLFLFFSSYTSEHIVELEYISIPLDDFPDLKYIVKEQWEKNYAEYYTKDNKVHFYLKNSDGSSDHVESFPINYTLYNFFITLPKNKCPLTTILQKSEFSHLSNIVRSKPLDEFFEITFNKESKFSYTIKRFLYKMISSGDDLTTHQKIYEEFLDDLERKIVLQYDVSLRFWKKAFLGIEIFSLLLYGSVCGTLAALTFDPLLLEVGSILPIGAGLLGGSTYASEYFEFKKCLNLINQAKNQQINNAEVIQ